MLYFTSPMCRPCRSFGPLLLDELARKGAAPERVDVSTDDGLELADAYGVVTVPTVVIEKDGEEVRRFGALLGDPLLDALSVL
ncbi:thioredoxin [Streptomyces phage Izzy]|uniref:Thioredoxin n=5 Tax=Likavirus izzy TaxID=1982888 RepID=A0A0K1Y961_9CAUD|nr:thioredoxin domain [Streptomyces phage Izzy]ATE84958.1 thioredoxin [Streptomyces phage BryanRecycles]ATE85260.1 thioredoxin [Streptomyces phage Jash]ATE85335.1 thioredoxin [Streptomyces phage Oliynyk]QDK03936.1 thioredoxin [Streptomyces phage Rusticus]AKY03612.1 thioredoxin [Streptomyces phage Izzy]